MLKRFFFWVPLAVLFICLPLSLSVADTVFYQCLDDEGRVHFKYGYPGPVENCLLLGAREVRQAVDDKVRKFFANNDGSMPELGENVVENGDRGLRSFLAKLKTPADPVRIYFVGDSHLQSGDFIRGVLDGIERERRVDRSDLCVHKIRKTRARKGRRRAVRLPKDYPSGVPRICAPLGEPADAPGVPEAERIIMDRRYPESAPISVFGYGITGKTFEYFSGSTLLERDLREFRPDLIVVMLGTNDAFARPEQDAMKRNIMSFLGTVRSASPSSDILFIAPPDSYFKDGRDNEYIAAIGRELRTTAGEQGIAFWDLYRVMGGQRSMQKWMENGLSQKDRIHFLADGYVILGRLFSQALMHSGSTTGM